MLDAPKQIHGEDETSPMYFSAPTGNNMFPDIADTPCPNGGVPLK